MNRMHSIRASDEEWKSITDNNKKIKVFIKALPNADRKKYPRLLKNSYIIMLALEMMKNNLGKKI